MDSQSSKTSSRSTTTQSHNEGIAIALMTDTHARPHTYMRTNEYLKL